MSKRNIYSLVTFSVSLVVLFLTLFFLRFTIWEDLPKNSKFYFMIFGFGLFTTLLMLSGIFRYLAVVNRKRQIEREKNKKELMSWENDFFPDRSF